MHCILLLFLICKGLLQFLHLFLYLGYPSTQFSSIIFLDHFHKGSFQFFSSDNCCSFLFQQIT
nr:hypothetical protein Iba_chr09eCG2060 [Ipomoea batatas]